MKVVLLLCIVERSWAVQQAFSADGRQEPPPPPPLRKTILDVFDKDKSGGVTEKEALATLEQLRAMSSMGQQPEPGMKAKPTVVEKMIDSAMSFVPTVFKILDVDSSASLDVDELVWIEKGLEGAKDGIFKDITRDIFATLDSSKDDILDQDELAAAVEPDLLARVIASVVDRFPLPGLSVAASPELAQKNLQDLVGLLDGNKDGSITKKEAGSAVGKFTRAYIKAAETLQSMGPMLAMFGGGGGGSPFGGPDMFGGGSGGKKGRRKSRG